MRAGARREMSPVRAGVLALVVLAVVTYFGFTKANPFANPYELKAVFDSASSLKPRSPVRIAGVDVGKVTRVEPVAQGNGAAKVTMEIRDNALPVHQDARLAIRQRIFLEGNFFVDVKPGSPTAPKLASGSTIPHTQTAAPVQFGELLTALQSDTRRDLQVFLREYSSGLRGRGARGFNDSIRYWRPAYKSSALVNDATLGVEPTRDLRRVLRGQAAVARGLVADELALKDLVTNLNTVAGALAREDRALEASIPALRDTLRAAGPALAAVNRSLPSLRTFARDALPGVRSSNPTLRSALPFMRQARRLFSRRELRGAAALLRRYTPDLVDLNEQSVALSREGRQLSACTNRVLVPAMHLRIPEHEFPANSNQKVLHQIQRAFVGLAGESRVTDPNTSMFHTQAVPPTKLTRVRPARPLRGGGVTPPSHRPDVPCETQELPNLNAPGGSITDPGVISLPPEVVGALPRARRRQPSARRQLRRLVERARRSAQRGGAR